MASRQGSGEAAVGVVVLLGQIFSIVLTLAALSPVLARLPAAWRAASDRCGLSALVLRCCGAMIPAASRCWSSVFERPPAKTLGGRGSGAAFCVRARCSQGQASLPQRLLAMPRLLAHRNACAR